MLRGFTAPHLRLNAGVMRQGKAMQFSKLELRIYLLISKLFESNADLNGHEYSDGYRSGSIFVGDESDPIYVVFSFPKVSNDCFLMITDGDPERLASEMAAIQEYSELTNHLHRDDTVPTNSSYLNASGWFAYLITSPKVSYTNFPNQKEIEMRNITFHLALPISENEREIKVGRGASHLFDLFDQNQRDTITFNQQVVA